MLARGDVYEVPHDRRARGHEQRGRRLGVVVQSEDLPLSTVILAPTSVSAPERTFRPSISIGDRPTRVLVEQLRAVDTGRLGARVGHLTAAEMATVEDALDMVLALDLRRH
ncbi:hypothetical protein BJF80_04515 [Serinicoccus sp. CUA-874]|uniref:type II toxin-antitoxin system PemK/MazF family toxin n=1 Tax=Serinicoccus TaxID=265976 RepID=UPI0003B5C3E7|nr:MULTISPECIES: type II toxin-antitoxin system PemK/MazF family toxin [Serinicoccus]OLT16628.1 hypothetical protein BJF80_04515 [Serinicoccus sp. CUA-874]